MFQWTVPRHGFSPDVQSLVFMAVALPALATIVCALYIPGVGERTGLARRRRAVAPSPA
jgi:hypothetical protein